MRTANQDSDKLILIYSVQLADVIHRITLHRFFPTQSPTYKVHSTNEITQYLQSDIYVVTPVISQHLDMIRF